MCVWQGHGWKQARQLAGGDGWDVRQTGTWAQSSSGRERGRGCEAVQSNIPPTPQRASASLGAGGAVRLQLGKARNYLQSCPDARDPSSSP